MNQPRPITIFDTTLRDGEQSPGASLNTAEKLEVAAALVELGVDVIEAGFPIASPGDFEAVREIARQTKGATICGLARCRDLDIERAWEAVSPAEKSRIHIFLATSPIHRQHKLRMTQDQVVERAVECVKLARSLCPDVEWSAEDASRTEMDFLCRVVEAVIEAGATTVNIPDTVGYATPEQYAAIIRTLKQNVKNIEQCVLSVHCHDDLGLATANSLAAVGAGAGQIECTINGIGERAGNAALEEIVMALRTRPDYFHARTRIDTQRLVPTSRLVSTLTGLHVPRNKSIVGRNAFAHESGIHQDGMLKERTTYEIMRPEDVGFQRTDLVLGKHSGRAALADRARTLGFHLGPEQLEKVFDSFKALADKKKEVYDSDVIALVQQEMAIVPDVWTLVSYQVTSGTTGSPSATLTLKRGEDETSTDVATGDGPVDAIYWAIEKITGLHVVCKEFQVQSVSVGKDAQAEVNVMVEFEQREYRGRGISTDTIEACLHAFLAAVNQIAAHGALKHLSREPVISAQDGV